MYHNKLKANRDVIVKTLRFFLLLILVAQSFISTAFAQTNLLNFMTPRDILRNDAVSGINLRNNGSSTANVYGLYVRQFSFVAPGDTCSTATVMYTGNITAGSVVMPIAIPAGKSAAIGSNYLYNMLYEANYYIRIIVPSLPPGCALPGCTWGSDSAIYNWCVHLGALGPVSNSSGYTSNVPPSTEAASGGGYNYNLISSYVELGPISCSDQTLTCTVANPQTQSFS